MTGLSTRISIIIPNLNSPVILATLRSLQNQAWPEEGGEILVVGRDEANLLATWADRRVRFIDTSRPVCAAAARNRGIAEAQGDVLIFVDSDCLAQPGWLETLLGRMAGGEDVVAGSVTFPADNYWTLADNLSMFHDFMPHMPAGSRPYLPTLTLAIRRHVAEVVGPLDETFPGAAGEDIDWTIRMRLAGFRLYFEPRAQVMHTPPRTGPRGVIRHWWRSGASMTRVRLRYAEDYGTPAAARSPVWLTVLSPLVAGWVSAKIWWQHPPLRSHWKAWPVVFATKLLWCWGGASFLLATRRVREETAYA